VLKSGAVPPGYVDAHTFYGAFLAPALHTRHGLHHAFLQFLRSVKNLNVPLREKNGGLELGREHRLGIGQRLHRNAQVVQLSTIKLRGVTLQSGISVLLHSGKHLCHQRTEVGSWAGRALQ
jgi:hypothetical protein